MADRTGISWTDATWNPVRGCSRVSEGCRFCYAEKVAARFSGPAQPYSGFADRLKPGSKWTGKVELVPHMLDQPLRWTRPRIIFVNSMSDLFHESLPDAAINQVFGIMALAHWHTFQVLTKRSGRMRAWFAQDRCRSTAVECVCAAYVDNPELAGRWPFDAERAIGVGTRGWPLPNVWLGVSVEDQAAADTRVPELLATPAAVRFLSCEPLLGLVDVWRWLAIDWQCSRCRAFFTGRHRAHCPECNAEGGWSGSHPFNGRLQPKRIGWPVDRGSGLDWIIVGGESGHGARPMRREWAESLRDQCTAAGVPFFFKQIGSGWQPDHSWGRGITGKGDNPEQWPAELRMQAFPR